MAARHDASAERTKNMARVILTVNVPSGLPDDAAEQVRATLEGLVAGTTLPVSIVVTPDEYDCQCSGVGHCEADQAEHWQQGSECGYCGADWIDGEPESAEPDTDAPPFCFCGHIEDSHDLNGCQACWLEESDDDGPAPAHAFQAVTDAKGRDL